MKIFTCLLLGLLGWNLFAADGERNVQYASQADVNNGTIGSKALSPKTLWGMTGYETSVTIEACFDQSGTLNRVQSPFESFGYFNRFYYADVIYAPFTLGRLTPAVLATGKTNLVAEIWLISTNTVTVLSTHITFFLVTNNPSGAFGGQWAPLPDPTIVFYPNTAATNWFRLATTSSIPIQVWTNLNGGWTRYSLYNNCTTNCWAGSIKFYLQ